MALCLHVPRWFNGLQTREASMFLLLQSSQKFESRKEDEESRKWEGSCDRKQENSPGRETQSLQATGNVSLGRFDLHEVAKTHGAYRKLHLA